MNSRILLEGPDEVGKTTLARLLNGNRPVQELEGNGTPGGIYDRSWVTNWVYRLTLPNFDWRHTSHKAPYASPDVDLIIILPADRDIEAIDQRVHAEHGYPIGAYGRLVHGYMAMYQHLALINGQGGATPLFRSLCMLQWVPSYQDGLAYLKEVRSTYLPYIHPASKLVLDKATARPPFIY